MQCQRSQYSFSSGRSACTFISLAAACRFGRVSEWHTVHESDLEAVLELGVQWYEACAPFLTVEHCSTEEAAVVLRSWSDGNVSIENAASPSYRIEAGVIHQRMLSVTSILEVLEEATIGSTSPVACVFTKPPETLMIIADQQRRRFLLFDSHPRPTLGIEVCITLNVFGCSAN